MSQNCLFLGGPFDGKKLPASRHQNSRMVGGHLYLKHTAVHPKSRQRRDFFFNAGSMDHSSPSLLDAVATWITGISPASTGRPQKKRAVKRKGKPAR